MSIQKVVLPGGVVQLTLSRPAFMNALNQQLLDFLRESIEDICQNNDFRGIIITGDGEKAFVAGADISELANLTVSEATFLAEKGQKLFKMIEELPKPVICAVNGFALGGGCELAMACHIRIASANARFGQPEVNLGIIPGYGGTQRLAQLVGRGKALELLMTGEPITAQEALAIGLVNQVVQTPGELSEACQKMMQKILLKAPVAISHVIRAVNAGFQSQAEGYTAEVQGFSECFGTSDFREGTSAFREKRKPIFKGS